MADENPTSRIIITAEIQGGEKLNQAAKSISDSNKNLADSAVKVTDALKKEGEALKSVGQGTNQGIKQTVQDFNDLVSVTVKVATPARELERALVRVGNVVDQSGEKARKFAKDIATIESAVGSAGEKAKRAADIIDAAKNKLIEFQTKSTGNLLGNAAGKGDEEAARSANRLIAVLKERSSALAMSSQAGESAAQKITGFTSANLEAAEAASVFSKELKLLNQETVSLDVAQAATSTEKFAQNLIGVRTAGKDTAQSIRAMAEALNEADVKEKQLRSSMTAGNTAALERVRINNLIKSSVVGGTSTQEAISRSTGAGATPSDSAMKLRNQLLLEQERALIESEKMLVVEIEKDRLVIQKAGDAYVPYAAKVRVAQEEVDELSRIIKTGGANATQASSVIVAAQKNLDDLRQKQIRALDVKAGGEDPKTVSDRLAVSTNKYLEALNPLVAVQNRYREGINEINKLTKAGLVTDVQAQQMLQGFIEKEQRAAQAIKMAANEQLNAQQITKRFGSILQGAQKDFVDYNSTATRAFGLNRIGLLELQAAGVNTFQALASGMSLTHVATMEGAQAFGAFVQGGLKIRTLLSIVAPIAAISAAIAVLIHRVTTIRTNLREFELSLSTMASGSNQTAQGLQKIIEHFKDLGVSADDTKKSINEVLKASEKGLSTNAIEPVIKTALNIQAVPTTPNAGDVPGTVKALSDALTGGIPGLIEYGQKLNALDRDHAGLIRSLAETEGKAPAVKRALELIANFYAGKYAESLGTGKQLTIAFKNAWDDFVQGIADSDFASFIVDQVTKSIQGLTNLIDKLDDYYKWLNSHQGLIGNLLDKIFPKEGMLGPFGKKIDELLNFEKNIGKGSGGSTEVTVPVQKSVIGSTATETNRLSISSNANLGTSDEIRKLTDMLGKAVETLPPGYKAIVESASRPGDKVRGTGEPSLHGVGGGRAVDVKIVGPEGAVKGFMGADTTGMYRKLETAVADIQKRDYPELSGKMQFGTKFSREDAGHIGIEGGRGRDTSGVTVESIDILDKANKRVGVTLDETQKKLEEQRKVLKLWPGDIEPAQAALDAFTTAVEANNVAVDPKKAGEIAKADALERLGIQWEKMDVIAQEAAKGTQKTVEAFGQSEVEGLKAAAAAEAYNTKLTSGIPVQQTYNQILTKNAVDAVLGAQKEVTAFGQVLTANKRLADATAEGTAAGRDAELQNEAIRSTHDALNNAMVLGNKTLEERARKLQEQRLEQLRVNESLVQTTDLERETNNLRKESKALQLETGLTASGASREQIDKEVANLRAIEKVNTDSAFATQESKKAYVNIVNSTGQWREKLAQVELAQRRINDIVLDIADTIGTSLTDRLEDAFDDKKAKDWGETVKGVLKDIIKSASDKLFIKPLLGSVAESLGFTSVASSLGTVSGASAIGATGALATGTASTSTGLVTKKDTDTTTSSGISGNTTTGLIGLGASTGSTGSVVKWINNTIGPLLGFSKDLSTKSVGGLTLGELEDLGIDTGSTGLFSSTLTSTAGSALSGLGAGALTSSLTGGSTIGGSVGGLVGGVAGSLLPIPGGSLIGGALGGLVGGLFGNSKTSNSAAGANLNLGTGKISGTVSSKDEASNQDVEDITGSVRDFAKDLAKETGLTVGGSVSVQSGLRDGIKVGFAGSLSNLGEKVYESAQDAIDDIELQLAKNLDGLSTTAKTVLDQLTDPADVQDALDFADAYDNLKKASDDAFSAIETDTDAIGPYAEAMDLLNEKFDDLTLSATEFGLSLDPITKGLDEATKRLQEDFGKSLDSALDASKANDFLNTLQDVSDAFVSNTKEAKAIGLDTDTGTTNKIAQLEVSAARETLDTLSSEDLQTVVDELATTAPEISKLAQSLLDLGSVSSDATDFLNDLDASLNLSKGKDFVNTLQDVSDAFVDNIKKANDLGLNDSATNLKLSAVEVEAANNTLKDLTKGELEDVVSSLADTAPEIAALAQDMLNLGTAVDDTSESIIKLADGIKSIKDLAGDLRTGKLSGLTDTSAAKSAIKEYTKDLSTAQAAGSNVTGNQLDKLAESGTAAIDASLKAYGNAPKTAELRRQVLKDLDSVLALANTAKTTTGTVVSTNVANNQWDILNKTVADAVTDTTDIPAAVGTEQTKLRDDTLAEAAAGGSMGTKAGKILVGEKGPEWMLPGYAMGVVPMQMVPGYGKGTERWKNWMKVGMSGPEIINQAGGATILPFPMHPKNLNLPGYAEGINDFGSVPESGGMVFDTLKTDTSNSDSMDGVVVELRGLRRDNRSMKDELAALKKQIQGGQTQANVDARKGNSTLSSINNKLGSGLSSVTRRSVG